MSGWSFQTNDKHPKLKPVTVNTCDGNNVNAVRDVSQRCQLTITSPSQLTSNLYKYQ